MSGSTFCWSTKQTYFKIHMCSYDLCGYVLLCMGCVWLICRAMYGYVGLCMAV